MITILYCIFPLELSHFNCKTNFCFGISCIYQFRLTHELRSLKTGRAPSPLCGTGNGTTVYTGTWPLTVHSALWLDGPTLLTTSSWPRSRACQKTPPATSFYLCEFVWPLKLYLFFAWLFCKLYLNYSDILTFVDDKIHQFTNKNNSFCLLFTLFCYSR